MGGSFETNESHSNASLKPLRLPTLQGDIYSAAKEMVEDLSSWTLKSHDDDKMTIVCERAGGLLSGASTVTITVEGPEGMPSSTVNCKSVSDGGILSRDKKNVLEFMVPFHRRVC